MLKRGDLYKHFKGRNLIEKNIYEILEVNVKYTGNANDVSDNLVVYRNIFQEGKIFAREEKDLLGELEENKQEQFNQKHRIEKLTQEEVEYIKTEEFIKAKIKYMKEREIER